LYRFECERTDTNPANPDAKVAGTGLCGNSFAYAPETNNSYAKNRQQMAGTGIVFRRDRKWPMQP